jgi:hypothetical protein
MPGNRKGDILFCHAKLDSQKEKEGKEGKEGEQVAF